MFDRFTAPRLSAIRSLLTRTRRIAIGAAAVFPALLIGVGSTYSDAPQDGGLVARACWRWPAPRRPGKPSPPRQARSAPARWPSSARWPAWS